MSVARLLPLSVTLACLAAIPVTGAENGTDSTPVVAPVPPTTGALPAESKPVSDPDAIVVTASRSAENLKDVPQSITVLTPDEIKRRQARTPNQMLREEPGVWSTQVNAQGSPIIRGQIGNRVLYLWNGVRLNNGALFSGPNGFFNQFPIGSVQRMEVLRGPGAVQYGSDAIGGVINIIGKQDDPFAAAPGLHGDVGLRYGTVDHEQTGYGDLSWVSNGVAANVGVTAQNVDDYRGPDVGELENTGYKAFGGHAGLAFKPLEDHTVRLSFVGNERTDVESYASSRANASGASLPRNFGPLERRWLTKGEYQIDHLATGSDELKAYGYYQSYEQERVQTNETGTLINRTHTYTEQAMVGAGVQNRGRIGPVLLTAGGDVRFEELESNKRLDATTKATGVTVSSVPNGNTPDGTYDVLDVFAIADLPLTDALTARLGGRYERTHLKSDPKPEDALAPFTVDDLEQDKTWDAPTGSLGLIYDLTHEWSLASTVATGYRAPTFSDTLSTGVPVFATGVASVPSPDFGPEKCISYELSGRYIGEPGWGSLTGYYTDLRDLAATENDGTINVPGVGTVVAQKKVNSGRGYVTGIELDAGIRITQQWTVFGNGTWTYSEDTVNDVPLRFTPPLNGLIGLRFLPESGRWWSEGVLVLVNRMTRHAPQDEIDAGFSTDPALGSPNTTTNPPLRSDFDLPGYAVVNLRGGYRVIAAGSKTVDLTLSLNNLFDTAYREAYSQQQLVAPGFNAIFGIEGAF
jgi:hemoglobin/transferrin/lactoferrin receptor protein